MLRMLAILFLSMTVQLSRPQVVHARQLDTTSLTPCGDTVAGEAIGGARFLSAQGQTVKLALVKAPEIWAPGAAYNSWPHGPESRQALQRAVSGKTITLFCEGQRTNRLGELVAHVVLPDGQWLAFDLVNAGDVFVFPGATRRQGLELLYQAEDAARAARKGVWNYNNLQPVEALGNSVKAGWFQIVRGDVREVALVRGTYYLNFGDDWRTDFTIEIPPIVARQFAKWDIDPMSLKGERVEGRGWVDFKSGPRLLVQGPGQLRQLPARPFP